MWRNLFTDLKLSKGKQYCESNAVQIYNYYENYVEAYIHGRDKYWAKIEFDNFEVKSMFCNCPYQYDNCKHLAAVFYYLENHPEIINLKDYSSLINSFTKKELTDFLFEELPNNTDLVLKLKNFKESQNEENNPINEKIYIIKLDNILNDSNEILKFIDNEIRDLITFKEFDLMFRLLTKILDCINQNEEYGDFPLLDSIIYKIDDIVTQVRDIASIDDITNFLINAIDNTDNYFVCDQLIDCLSRNGDMEYYVNRLESYEF